MNTRGLTSAQLATHALTQAGGTAPRADVLNAVATHRGRREAFLGTAMAILGGHIEETTLDNNVPGLRLRASTLGCASNDPAGRLEASSRHEAAAGLRGEC